MLLIGLAFLSHSGSGMKIKFDGRTIKILLITTIVSTFLFLTGLFCMLAEVEVGDTVIVVIVLLGLYVGGGIFLFAGLNLLIGFCYIRRLKAYGYEVPYKKEDYGNDLRNVPRVSKNSCQEAKNVGSRVLSFIYAAVFLLVNVWNVRYIVRWHPYLGNDAVVFGVLLFLLDSFWAIAAFVFFRQADTQRYRDDVEIEDGRKERISLDKGIVDGIILLCIMMLIKSAAVGISDLMFYSRVEHDQDYLSTIRKEITVAMMEEHLDQSSYSYMQMTEGCYITDWGEPEDAFSQRIAEALGISDYSQMKENIYTSDGEPRIYVKISDMNVDVYLDNPLRLDHGTQYP